MNNNTPPKLGAPPKEVKKKKISLTLSPDQHEKLQIMALKSGKSFSQIAGEAIDKEVVKSTRIVRRSLKPNGEKGFRD
tara:strand:- start:63 stop:296 length:234 start_codon:yes stop_codon:yes gene_type:complete